MQAFSAFGIPNWMSLSSKQAPPHPSVQSLAIGRPLAWRCALAVCVMLPLSGCDKASDAKNKSTDEVAVGKGAASFSQPVTPKNDPRVVEVDGKLHSRKSGSVPDKDPPKAHKPKVGLGTGRPDESNGVCRLYAPKYPNPICCDLEYGFVEERARELCGLSLYLGESARNSCGYFFLRELSDQKPVSFRLSRVMGESVQEVAETHDALFQRRLKNKNFKSTPVPGVPGALWSNDEGYNWAFVPGWDNVRQVSWLDDSCPRDKMALLIKDIVAFKQRPEGSKRRSMTPGGISYAEYKAKKAEARAKKKAAAAAKNKAEGKAAAK